MTAHIRPKTQVIGCDLMLLDKGYEHFRCAPRERSNEIRIALAAILAAQARKSRFTGWYRLIAFLKGWGFKIRPFTLAHLFVALEPAVCILLIACALVGFVALGWQMFSSNALSWWLFWSAVGCIIAWLTIEVLQTTLDRLQILPPQGASIGWAHAQWERQYFKDWEDGHYVPAFVYELVTAVGQQFSDVRCSIHQLRQQWKGEWQKGGRLFLSVNLPDGTSLDLASWDEASP